MKRQFLLALCLSLLLRGVALSAQKSVIIGFKQKPGAAERAMIHAAEGTVTRTYRIIPAMAASLPEKHIQKLKQRGNVAYVADNPVYFAAAAPAPGQEYENSWGVSHIFADVTHATGNKGTGVKVAILDTGIDYTHEDLNDNYQGGYDFVFEDNDPFDDSFNSHGTHVAGVIGAEQNGVGVVGVAPEAQLFAVKVLDGGGFGKADWIIAGIEWAVSNNIHVINISIQGPDSQPLHDACDSAYNAGVLLVAAGGSSIAGQGPVTFPAAYDSVIAVTGIDQRNQPGSFAPRGPELELAAPGVDVLSTVAGGGYELLSGSSQAAPHVAGVAALTFLSNKDDLTGDGAVDHQDVRYLLQRTALDLGDSGKDDAFGLGLVNGAAASLQTEMALTVTRTQGRPANDADGATVAGRPFEITIANHGCSKLDVDVFDGEVLRKDLSRCFHFAGNAEEPAVFSLDATGACYDVFFAPYGKRGAFADILIRRDVP